MKKVSQWFAYLHAAIRSLEEQARFATRYVNLLLRRQIGDGLQHVVATNRVAQATTSGVSEQVEGWPDLSLDNVGLVPSRFAVDEPSVAMLFKWTRGRWQLVKGDSVAAAAAWFHAGDVPVEEVDSDT